MNLAIIQGNLTRDMEISQSGDLKIAKGSIALSRGKDKDGNDKGADFPSIVAFGKKAEFFEKFGKKGRRFTLETHIQTGSYEKDGVKRYTTDFVVDRIEFADSKPANSTPEPQPDADGFLNIPEGDFGEIPFN